MPIPIPRYDAAQPTLPPRPRHAPNPQQYYSRNPQDWAITQEQYRHNLPLFTHGEWAMYFLMWTALDFNQGLVGKCSRCYQSGNNLENRRSAVYNQPTQKECPNCFGTSFEGGYRARIVRPSMFADVDEDVRQDRRGEIHPTQVSVETTSDFRMRAGDHVIRADGSRWRLPSQNSVFLRTGFDHPTQFETGVTLNKMRAQLEEPTTVAYLLPPTDKATVAMLLNRKVRFRQDFSDIEIIRTPLIPVSTLA